ncbi:MAG: hypothetical protein RBT74_12705 [Tenuifilaceae bacterium]|nr:hypothetical protein [Tenuifilaceae bacterium]
MAKNLLFSLFLFLSLQTLARVGDNKGFSIISPLPHESPRVAFATAKTLPSHNNPF